MNSSSFTLWGFLLVIINLLVFVGIAPFYDGVVRRVAARIQNRLGPPLTQTYFDVFKLLGKENLDSAGNIVFRIAPLVALASMFCVIALIPLGGQGTALTPFADAISLVYLLTLGGVAVLLGAFASRNIYALIGASREMSIMIMVEPIFFMILMLGVIKTGTLDLTTVLYATPLKTFGIAGIIMGIVALFALQAFVGRQPFDMAEAEQEILGGPFIEYSGPNYAIFKLYLLLKQMFYAWLPVAMFLPLSGTGFFLIDLIIQLLLTGIIFLLIGLLAATHPRFRIDQALKYFAALFVVSLGAMGIALL